MSMNIDTKPSAQTLRGIFDRDVVAFVAWLSSGLRIRGLGRGATFETVGALTEDANRAAVWKQQCGWPDCTAASAAPSCQQSSVTNM
ncbi:protein of unknown function [Pseudomonas sp. JV551A1]|nr:protein of unknown function [Pseudomonas sp. JV551A1]